MSTGITSLPRGAREIRIRASAPPSAARMPSRHIVGAWLLIVVAMIANGALRVGVLTPRLGDAGAGVASAALGIAIILSITRPFVRRMSAPTAEELLRVGLIWVGLSIAFEFFFGHYVLRASWAELVANYNLLRGRLWPLVLASAVAAPFLWARPGRRD